MLRFLADEDFNFKIVTAVRTHAPDVDIVSVQEVNLSGQSDPQILDWAAQEGRILLTHDNRTMPEFAWERMENQLYMPGLFVVKKNMAIRQALEEIVLIATCSIEGEWDGRVVHIPLQ